MYGYHIRAGIGERIDKTEGILYHKMGIENRLRVRAESLYEVGTERNVRHELPVHDIKVQIFGSGIVYLLYTVGSIREIAGKHRR